jgi:hypothetical protein
MNLKGYGRKWSWANQGTILQSPGRTEETVRNCSQDSWHPGQDSNWAPPKYRSRVLPVDNLPQYVGFQL